MKDMLSSNGGGEGEGEGEGEGGEPIKLPGFRFHPTDEELVGFYLRMKVEKKQMNIELIKQADIYKYDPWDLPKWSINGGEKEKEWYFFCKRGRKYKNSVRPNRVTCSGFWKATGIDRAVLSGGGNCIGLKKSLVYYRGTAGKGTKTDWMMHEFRLPDNPTHAIDAAQQPAAEVWTLCRILKRTSPYKNRAPDSRLAAKKLTNSINNQIQMFVDASSESCSIESNEQDGKSSYISFGAPMLKQNLYPSHIVESTAANIHDEVSGQCLGSASQAPPAASSFSNYNIHSDINEVLWHGDWEDLQSLLNCPAATNAMYF